MPVGIEEIKKLETITKVKLSEEERAVTKDYFEELINRFDQMEAIPTGETEPLVSVSDLKNIMREDIASQMVTREELLKNAVEEHNGYFKVPKTID